MTRMLLLLSNILSIFLFAKSIETVTVQYNLYHTTLTVNGNDRDCFYYYIFDNLIRYRDNPLYLRFGSNYHTVHQIIPFCRRDQEKSSSKIIWKNSSSKDFDQLLEQNVTSDELYLWSAPIDLIEDYENYAIYKEKHIKQEQQSPVYYNCTLPRFGTHCQYSFYRDDEDISTLHSFTDIIENAYEAKSSFPHLQSDITNGTCYIHLRCYHGPAPSCLDWREICDGKVDCLDGNYDEPKVPCLEFEKTKCPAGQYRCHNGMQCIPGDFFHDDIFNPDCLDRTDEIIFRQGSSYPERCQTDAAMRCEDTMCTHPSEAVCGYGICSLICPQTTPGIRRIQAIVSREGNMHLTYKCWNAMICLLKIQFLVQDHHCNCENEMCVVLLEQYCEQTKFLFPLLPIAFGHVRLLYSLATRQNLKSCTSSACQNRLITPDHICFKYNLCFSDPTILTTSHEIFVNGSSLRCKSIDDTFNTLENKIFSTWLNQVQMATQLFVTCSTHIDENKDDNDDCLLDNDTIDSSLFHCLGTLKCISKYRLLDGMRDCYFQDDEILRDHNKTCSYEYRYKCKGDSNKCIPSTNVLDNRKDCPLGDDEKQVKPIDFTLLCDGFEERAVITDDPDNETDETNCEYWQCNNQYTRCDGIWNCFNGEDEANCTGSPCNANYHPCISINTSQFICLPLELAGNGIVDCFGGSDERSFCRKKYANKLAAHYRYLCNNSENTVCIKVTNVCDKTSDCPFLFDDDENKNLCQMIAHNRHDGLGIGLKRCSSFFLGINRSMHNFNFLCSLTDSDKYFGDEFPELRPYFSLQHQRFFPIDKESRTIESPSSLQKQSIKDYSVNIRHAHICNRGILIYEYDEEKCLCPPAYYGIRCEFQNQRLSVTLQIRTALWNTHFRFVFMLIGDDEQQQIESHEQISYLAVRDCSIKYNLNLLYATRPKSVNKSYSIRIDAFSISQTSVIYHASWLFMLKHNFLPVHRLAIQLSVPAVHNSPLERGYTSCLCGSHGQCFLYVNTKKVFCRCNIDGWKGKNCQISPKETRNYCSSDSIPIDSTVCVCPTGKFGPRCTISSSSICTSSNPCANGGTCVPVDPLMMSAYSSSFTCVCVNGFSGNTCEQNDTQLHIDFAHHIINIPLSVLIHFITVRKSADPDRSTTIVRIPVGQSSIKVYRSSPFHIVFIETMMDESKKQKSFYLAFTQETSYPSVHLFASVLRQCSHLDEFFNSTILAYAPLRRVKYYHIPCQKQIDLACFYDDVHFMCLCTEDRRANCFQFDFDMSYTCRHNDYCEHNGQCFQNHPTCPTAAVCSCADCYHGSRCQFSSRGFGLSLDTILGYHIWPHLPFRQQSIALKLSTAMTVLMFIIGLTNSIFTMITFRSTRNDSIGCEIYLFTGSINSMIITFLFTFKFLFLVLAQLTILQSRFVLAVQCILLDFLMRVLLSTSDWLTSCIAMERVFTIIRGIHFDAKKSRQVTKWVIGSVYLFTFSTHLHDPIHRRLIDDQEDQRTSCIAKYSQSILESFATCVSIFHFIIPFSINFTSAIIIIISLSRIRSHTKKQLTRRQRLLEQFNAHKHLLISSVLLVLLALPRLIISVTSGCIKAQTRDVPWLLLSGYFVSFIPSLLTFMVFVLPSTIYMHTFREAFKQMYPVKLWNTLNCIRLKKQSS